MKLSFRPHHFLCTLGFQGKGYSPVFVRNYKKIAEALQKDEDLSIEVVPVNDSICKACPHLRTKGCSRESKVRSLDERHAHVLGLKAHEQITWREAKSRLKHNMSLELFYQACQGCSWKSLGLCEKALRSLQENS